MNHIQIQKELEQEYFDELELDTQYQEVEWLDDEDVYSKSDREMKSIGMNSRRDFL